MQFHWYKMTAVGKWGLSLFAICAIFFYVTIKLPRRPPYDSLAMLLDSLSMLLGVILLAIGTPLIWLADYFIYRLDFPEYVFFILLALNCYLWGFVICWLKRKMDRAV